MAQNISSQFSSYPGKYVCNNEPDNGSMPVYFRQSGRMRVLAAHTFLNPGTPYINFPGGVSSGNTVQSFL